MCIQTCLQFTKCLQFFYNFNFNKWKKTLDPNLYLGYSNHLLLLSSIFSLDQLNFPWKLKCHLKLAWNNFGSSSKGLRSNLCDWSILLDSHLNCRNPTLAKCGGEAQHLEKVGIGVLRDSRKLRRRFARPKNLALGCSWCHWKGLET